MALFATPEDHAVNPPSTWLVVKAGQRWSLQAGTGGELDSFTTRRAAEAARTSGPLAALYEKEARWYAGEAVSGWRPYADIAAGQSRQEARLPRVAR